MLRQENTNQAAFGQPSSNISMLRKRTATATEIDNPLLKRHAILNSG